MKKLVYIPLDNRPVLVDRIILQASSCGFETIIPDIDLVSTKLDNQPLNSNGTQYGNVEALENWLENNISDDVDFYLISVDQLLSGGLVSSRYLSNEDISFEKKVIDKFFGENGLLVNKKVYLFDTLMRLAPTVGYMGYKLEDYSAIRQFGSIERYVLSNDELTLDNIFRTYDLGINKEVISLPDEISLSKKEKYYASRKRKLSITDYLLNRVGKINNIYYICGIDDSSPCITIQTNEVNYINKIKGKNSDIIIGTDELSSILICRFLTEYYNYNPSIKLTYIGSEIDVPADYYDNGTLRTNLDNHLKYMGINLGDDNSDVEVVVLTKPSENRSHEFNVSETIKYVENKVLDNKLVILIDCSTMLCGTLQKALINKNWIGRLLSYSNWNTVANAVGLSLGQGISRFIYLKNEYNKEDEFTTTKAYTELLALSYFKDMAYKVSSIKMVENHLYENLFNQEGVKENNSYMNFYKYLKYSNIDCLSILKYYMEEIVNPCNVKNITNSMLDNKVLSKYNSNEKYREYYCIKGINNIEYSFPWNRTFEIGIRVNCDIEKIN